MTQEIVFAVVFARKKMFTFKRFQMFKIFVSIQVLNSIPI